MLVSFSITQVGERNSALTSSCKCDAECCPKKRAARSLEFFQFGHVLPYLIAVRHRFSVGCCCQRLRSGSSGLAEALELTVGRSLSMELCSVLLGPSRRAAVLCKQAV